VRTGCSPSHVHPVRRQRRQHRQRLIRRIGSPGEYVDYAASKGAIDTLTLGLAKEVVAQGIRVNAVRLGVFDTGIHASGGQPDRAWQLAPALPMQRPGRPAEAAAAITWLCSGAASYITGAVLDVSGGL